MKTYEEMWQEYALAFLVNRAGVTLEDVATASTRMMELQRKAFEVEVRRLSANRPTEEALRIDWTQPNPEDINMASAEMEEVRIAIMQRKPIDAIKLLREKRGIALRRCRDVINVYRLDQENV